MSFSVEISDKSTSARTGILTTRRGKIETPVFMPIGTYGAVKTLSPAELKTAGASIILGNTYHLYLRPGLEVIRAAGGLHDFMAWDGLILTDSGGFQVFSLAKLRRISQEGVVFTSGLDGSEHEMTPERAMEIQLILGSDIMMALDECPPGDAPVSEVEKAVERTSRWAEQCATYLHEDERFNPETRHFFPIIQGSVDESLRKRSADELIPLAKSGVAVGGLAVGEEKETMFDTLAVIDGLLPGDRARYLMGVGKPDDLVRAVANGMDMFDCVIPTRNARNGQIFTWGGCINLRNQKFKEDFAPMDESCTCYACHTFSRAYLRHLFNLNEMLGLRMATLHNVTFYLSLMERIRAEIRADTFDVWSRDFMKEYGGES